VFLQVLLQVLLVLEVLVLVAGEQTVEQQSLVVQQGEEEAAGRLAQQVLVGARLPSEASVWGACRLASLSAVLELALGRRLVAGAQLEQPFEQHERGGGATRLAGQRLVGERRKRVAPSKMGRHSASLVHLPPTKRRPSALAANRTSGGRDSFLC